MATAPTPKLTANQRDVLQQTAKSGGKKVFNGGPAVATAKSLVKKGLLKAEKRPKDADSGYAVSVTAAGKKIAN